MIYSDSDFIILDIKKSTIPKAGCGVFAKLDIPAGAILAEYRGTVWKASAMTPKDKISDKFINIGKSDKGEDFMIDGVGVASMINDCIDLQNYMKTKEVRNHKGKEYNCKFQHTLINGKLVKMFVIATKDIKKGEELFIPYGIKYWETRVKMMK